ncbi:hypothetical protein FG386_000025 [Cryptosporidium ryanae]|uniref:uncharacterized protein n=1 Tax=Cryptosporidium ryanae TaxID=515981 RepID=UPI00351A7C87|nr:hypothetical protein FG386_000025 [Cryptosporidium ryanae]
MIIQKRTKNKTFFVNNYILFSIFVLVFYLKFCIITSNKQSKSIKTQTSSTAEEYGENLNNLESEITYEKENTLFRLTCGSDGREYSKSGAKFIKQYLKSFSTDDFNRLKYLKLLPIFYLGKNDKLMLKSFMRGELLGAPLRLRARIIQSQDSIPIIEDDFQIVRDLNNIRDEEMNVINNRVANEIRYTTILCGGEIISFLPVIRYIKELSRSGINLGNDPIIISGISMFERDKAISRRKHAEIEMRYLSTLPFADEIYSGKKIMKKGLLVGAPEFIQEKGVYDSDDINTRNKEDLEEGVLIGMKVRAREEYFQQGMENILKSTQPKSVYTSIFDFGLPEAFFSTFNGSHIDNRIGDFGTIGHKKGIPHKITTADAMNFSTLNRIKSSLDKYRAVKKGSEYSIDGSVGMEENIDYSKVGEKKTAEKIEYYNPESILIGKALRSNDQISRGYSESKNIFPNSNIPPSEINEISNFPLFKDLPREVSKIINSDFHDLFGQIKNITSGDEFNRAFKRFPAYLSQTKILPVSAQAYIFWESMKYSNELLDENHGIKIANFPKNEVPSLDILPKKIPRVKDDITHSCYKIVRFFQRRKTPFIFLIKLRENEGDNNKVELINPLKSKSIQAYKNYVKILCNSVLPNVFISLVHLVFEGILIQRENRFHERMEERKQELDVQEKEEILLRKIKESVTSRSNITPYLIENPYERYLNAWRRSIGYFGSFLYPKKIQTFEKIYNIVKFGPEIIKKKNDDLSPEQVRSAVSKAIVKLVDENFTILGCSDLFLNIGEIESFIVKIFSTNIGISIDSLLREMPIKPEINIKTNIKSLKVEDLYISCIDFIKPIIKYSQNIQSITENELIKGKVNEQLKLKDSSENKVKKIGHEDIGFLENGYEASCSVFSSFLTMNIVNFNLCFGKSDGYITKLIKNIFLHQTLTDESSKIPVELGLKMFEATYFDIFERVSEQHGIYFVTNEIKKVGNEHPIFNLMLNYPPTELTSETINFTQIETIFSVVFDSIVKNGDKRLEFFNENIMAKYILRMLKEQDLIVPKNIKTVPRFPISHTYPWSALFYPGLVDWCNQMIHSLTDENLIRDKKTGQVLNKESIKTVIDNTCREEIIFGIRNNIEYEADEILRRNFACHFGASLVYWHYKRPIPKWIFFDQWETVFDPEPEITITEEPEISLTTFLILKCIVDLEFPALPKIGKNKIEIKKELSNQKISTETRKGVNLSVWNATPIKSIENKNTLSYFLFPNVISRESASKIAPEEILAFSGPHEIIWVGANEKEFIPMCLNSIEKLSEFIRKKKNNYFELDIWVTDDDNSRDLICRDVFGRFFYPKTTMNCDKAVSEDGYISNQHYSIERAKLRRSQWLAIQESIKMYKLSSENNKFQIYGQLPLSSFVVDFRESDDFTQPGGFVKNCIAAFDSAILTPVGSPYSIKAANIDSEIISKICNNAMELYYTSANPMSWDEQQTRHNKIDLGNNYIVSRIALAQHRAILEQIVDQNEAGDNGLRNSNRFNFYYNFEIKIKVSDNTQEFIENCEEYVWECINNKIVFLENGFDITNSKNLVKRTCNKASFRYFFSEIPLTNEDLKMIISSEDEISEWHRVRFKTGQWRILSEVFNSLANEYPGGFLLAVTKTFNLPRYMQLANFNTSKEILPIEEDCLASISYLIKLYSCASEFTAIFGGIVEFCKRVSEVYKRST